MGKEEFNLEVEILKGVSVLNKKPKHSSNPVKTDSPEAKPKKISEAEKTTTYREDKIVVFTPRIRLNGEQFKKLRLKAALENVSMKEIIEKVAVDYINNIIFNF